MNDVATAPTQYRDGLPELCPMAPHVRRGKILNTDSRFGNSKKRNAPKKSSAPSTWCGWKIFVTVPSTRSSGGQQQRIALARALVIEPSVLLLDEPISNLDAALRQQMRDEIKQIHDRTNITMFYVTHDQVDALSMADRMAIMQDGVIIQVGTPREVYQFPKNTFVASFVGKRISFQAPSSRYQTGVRLSKHPLAHSTLQAFITNSHTGDLCSVPFDQRHSLLTVTRTAETRSKIG